VTEREGTKELIKKLEKKIAKLEEESRTSVEDQLFFGVIISLVVFVLELDIPEVVSLFQTAGFTLDTASSIALGVRNVTLLCLIAASATRYYGVVSGKMKSRTYRLRSLQCLIMAWNFFIFLFTVNALSDIISLGSISLPVALFIMLVAFLLMKYLEKKILSFYASRKLIFKKDVYPNVSEAFLILNAGLCFAIAIEVSVMIFLSWNFSSERFVAFWILLPLLLILWDRHRKKAKRKPKT
jgi:hypothetical protein